jgi:hypothetical protein
MSVVPHATIGWSVENLHLCLWRKNVPVELRKIVSTYNSFEFMVSETCEKILSLISGYENEADKIRLICIFVDGLTHKCLRMPSFPQELWVYHLKDYIFEYDNNSSNSSESSKQCELDNF